MRFTSKYLLFLLMGCSSTNNHDELAEGQISYPFVQGTRPLGINGKEEKFVIKSTNAQGTEYAVEIPHAANDYEVEVPLAENSSGKDSLGGPGRVNRGTLPQPTVTDTELVNHFPRLSSEVETDKAVIDHAFGVGEVEGPGQSPSYTLGLARVNEYYKQNQFEYALIEINQLLSYYPNSVRLLKMKGTVLMKLSSPKLAEKAWVQASALAPEDRPLKRSLERLRRSLRPEELPPPIPNPTVSPLAQPVMTTPATQPEITPIDPGNLLDRFSPAPHPTPDLSP